VRRLAEPARCRGGAVSGGAVIRRDDYGLSRALGRPWVETRAATARDIEALYRERYSGFRRAIARVTGSYESAHDVVQEAFARALTRADDYRGDGPLGAWVWSIAMRLAYDERRLPFSLPLEEVLDCGLESSYDSELAHAVRSLPARRRLVFFLRYFADLSYHEIAATCAISEGTVAATIAQARAEVMEKLGRPHVLPAESS
jgi:RNA polymerase sigma-70 factor (ECF subfamily)